MAILSTLAQSAYKGVKDLLTYVTDSGHVSDHVVRHWKAYTMIGFGVGLLVNHVNSMRGLPPGPWGVPGLGVLPFLSANPHVQFREYGKKYGEDIISLRVGTRLVVVLNSVKATKEAFLVNNTTFADRPPEDVALFQDAGFNDKFFYRHYSPETAKDRKFALRAMREFGQGQASMEERVDKEIDFFLRLIRAKRDPETNQIDVINYLCYAMGNVIMGILFNRRFELPDQEYENLVATIQEWNVEMIWGAYMNVIPFGRRILRTHHSAFERATTGLLAFVGKQFDEHKATLDPDETRDVTDVYLKETDINRYDFTGAAGILVPDAVETAPLMFQWLLFYMAKYPDIQKKVQQEVDGVTGRSRLPCYDDKPSLPYTEATMFELFRHVTIFPQSFPHRTTSETTVCGYRIPKHCTVVSNFYAAHMDSREFKDPEKFDPTRFLDSNGAFLRSKTILTFSLGRRGCMGEVLTKMELFLFFAHLMHHFDIGFPLDKPAPSVYFNDHAMGRLGGAKLTFTDRVV